MDPDYLDMYMDMTMLMETASDEEMSVGRPCSGRGIHRPKKMWHELKWPTVAVEEANKLRPERKPRKTVGRGRAQLLRERQLMSKKPGRQANEVASVSSTASSSPDRQSSVSWPCVTEKVNAESNDAHSDSSMPPSWPANAIAERKKAQSEGADSEHSYNSVPGRPSMVWKSEIEEPAFKYIYPKGFGSKPVRDKPDVDSFEDFPTLGSSSSNSSLSDNHKSKSETFYSSVTKLNNVSVISTSEVKFVHGKKKTSTKEDKKEDVNKFSSLAGGLLSSSVASDSSTAESTKMSRAVAKSDKRSNSFSQVAKIDARRRKGVLAREGSWEICGPNVVQIENLPDSADLTTLDELLQSFGKVVNTSLFKSGSEKLLQVQFDSSDTCDWVVSCLNGTDTLFGEGTEPLQCFIVA